MDEAGKNNSDNNSFKSTELKGNYVNKIWNSNDTYHVSEDTHLNKCVLNQAEIIVQATKILKLEATTVIRSIVLQPKAILYLIDQSYVKQVVQAQNALIIEDENSKIETLLVMPRLHGKGCAIPVESYLQDDTKNPYMSVLLKE